ncbi:MAG: SDR family oxidoreductase [Sphingomonadaceae bacterium]|nr:SDR family oxidoreductase [Sphingomonadaceae bacterium]
MKELMGLDGKRVLIVGGGQGNGEATAHVLASLGCNVAILDLELDRAEKVCKDIEAMGVSAYPISCDVLVEEQLVGAIAEVDTEFGPLDGMVCIIGMAGWAPITEMTTEVWDMDHQRNLRFFFWASRELASRVLARNGKANICALASVDGIRAAALHASYGAAKAGLIHLAKSMAAEWSSEGIRVNIVAPGAIITPRIPEGDADGEAAMSGHLPLGRRGTTMDIAKAVTFFMSDLSSYVTGQTLAVDGGYTANGWPGIMERASRVKTGGTMGVDD